MIRPIIPMMLRKLTSAMLQAMFVYVGVLGLFRFIAGDGSRSILDPDWRMSMRSAVLFGVLIAVFYTLGERWDEARLEAGRKIKRKTWWFKPVVNKWRIAVFAGFIFLLNLFAGYFFREAEEPVHWGINVIAAIFWPAIAVAIIFAAKLLWKNVPDDQDQYPEQQKTAGEV